MSWHGIEAHDEVVEQFRCALARGRLASSFLFVGPAGIGKRLFAMKLAQTLLCEQHPESAMDPCGRCAACQQVEAGTHPDVEVVVRPKDKSFIPLDLLLGDKEHRGREGLCHTIAMKPFRGGRKVAVIDDADYLNPEGANALLKTLEEPPPRSVLVLIGTTPAKQLPTIRSRCQMIRFRPLPEATVAELLVAKSLVDNPADAARLAQFSEGSLQRAIELADPELWDFRRVLYRGLADKSLDGVGLARTVAKFVDGAGKQAAARRDRFRQVVGFAVEFYRQVLHGLSGVFPEGDSELKQYVDRALHAAVDVERVAARLQRCLDAGEQIDRNANQSTLIEAWLNDLAAA